ncbi:excisionase family DNA binding protein [Microbacterium resistens]|uniref:Excisionase family DNA binding protein n=1 Tax=Microbacterium resistens TaxID=156977 RepID=A0ABU1SE27_9MICO|nr:helix-turn-helix domain-containing protein [Microbacterium resistens]MDR6867868.1 excisionase family DNA binding protein [Microbacterium resistens]
MSVVVRLFTIPDAGGVLGRSRDTVYRMVAAGELRAVRIRRGSKSFMRIREDDLQAYIDSLEAVE